MKLELLSTDTLCVGPVICLRPSQEHDAMLAVISAGF